MSDSSPALSVKIKEFRFPGSSRVILKDVTVDLAAGESVAIMGPSAAGKTTFLKGCAGLKGYELPPDRHQISGRFAMLFQDNVLLEYLSARDNIALPGEIAGVAVDVEGIAERLGIMPVLSRYPREISGGQRKRVALARSLAYPDLKGILMDEPLSAMDLPLRESILVDLRRRLDETGLSCLFSTHNASEAVYLADRIVFLSGTPATIVRTLKVSVGKGYDPLVFQNRDFQQATLEVEAILRSLGTPNG
jgi:NitT/TauT family transport system ATP-binding protein